MAASSVPAELQREPLIEGPHSDQSLTTSLLNPVWELPTQRWFALLTLTMSLMGMLLVCIVYLEWRGIGVWGNNIPVGWAFDIINFVWWIGIGHAGTLISAILLLFQQEWRTSINRFAEAMTIFAVMCAGLYPALHTGRAWFDYWLFPIPNTMGMWPNFKSPLMWDVFAISTYATVSILFWFLGLIPDLAMLRDTTKSKTARIVYGIFALGWRGSANAWKDYRWAYLLLAGLSTPLVLSVHTIVSFDFATSLLPGWHTTVFPPYFVAGAVFSGFALVVTLMIPARKFLRLEHVITLNHFDVMAKVMLVTGWMVTYGYAVEMFNDWYSGSPYEIGQLMTRFKGPYAPFFWALMFCNCLAPNVFWFKSLRRNLYVLWVLSIIINIGMWLERFVIIVISLHRDFIPGSWGMYAPTWVDICMFMGTFGLFGTLFLLFLKFLPAVAVTEVKEYGYELNHHASAMGDHGHGHGGPAPGEAH